MTKQSIKMREFNLRLGSKFETDCFIPLGFAMNSLKIKEKKMLKQFVFVFTLVLGLSFINFAQEKPDTKKDSIQKIEVQKETASKEPWNKVCPVKGNPIEDDSPTVEYNGKVYAFCCPGCDTKFAKNPEKYAKNLSEDGKKFVGKK